ncbi:acyltransferase family protein [Brevibacillus agri]|uniref:acyltransferase family protein n=1 Tax=Brevibacillus agri TaxID=51101 RepID=UPI003D73BCDD
MLPSLGVPYVILSPVWVFYFVLGMYISKEIERFIRLTQKITFVKTTLIWLLTLIILLLDSKYTNTSGSSTKPSTILYTLSSLVFLFKGLSYIAYVRPKMSSIILWYSTHSFFIYLIHPFIISCLVLVFPHNWGGTIGLVQIFISTIILSTLLTYIGSKFKLIHILGGVYTGRLTHAKSSKTKSDNEKCMLL